MVTFWTYAGESGTTLILLVFRLALFRLFAWRYFVFSSLRITLFRGEKTKKEKEMAQTSYYRSKDKLVVFATLKIREFGMHLRSKGQRVLAISRGFIFEKLRIREVSRK